MDIQLTQLTPFLQTGGIGIFTYYLVRGLNGKIDALNGTIGIMKGTIEAQEKTLSAMERRVEETEKVGNIYRNLVATIPQDVENYKTFITKTKDEIIVELQNKNQHYQKQLSDAKTIIESGTGGALAIAQHMKILKYLLTPKRERVGADKTPELLKICEFDGRKVEDSVLKISSSARLQDFLQSIGISLIHSEDISIIPKSLESRKSPTGEPIKAFMSTQSLFGGWYAVINDHIYANAERIKLFESEFTASKSVV